MYVSGDWFYVSFQPKPNIFNYVNVRGLGWPHCSVYIVILTIIFHCRIYKCILVARRSHSNEDFVHHLGFLNRFFAYWRSIREVYSVIDRLHATSFIQSVFDILVRGEIINHVVPPSPPSPSGLEALHLLHSLRQLKLLFPHELQ